jgi:xanthine dehydrogenase accessory factor
MEALRSSAFYVGALGSRRNQAARKARLKEHFGLTDLELDRLHGPVGLHIHAKTPAEIAVSIVAQLVQVKHAPFPDAIVAMPQASGCGLDG